MTGEQISLDDAFAHARHTDPDTSHTAAASVNVRRSQEQVLALLRTVGPATDDGLVAAATARALPLSPSGVRTRRNELVRAGLVEDTGERVRLASGRHAIVWAAA